jgi:hypothetical protein
MEGDPTMCCLLTALVAIGPRAAIFVWWLIDPVRWQLAFGGILWPLLGLLFLPWTTLMYVAVAPGGIDGLDWIVIAIGFAIDIAAYSGGAYGNRNRVPGYGS